MSKSHFVSNAKVSAAFMADVGAAESQDGNGFIELIRNHLQIRMNGVFEELRNLVIISIDLKDMN